MRMSERMRTDFVDKVISDAAWVDYCGMAEKLLREDAEMQIPKSIKALIDDPFTTHYIGLSYVRSKAAGTFAGIQVKGAYNVSPTPRCDKELVELQTLHNIQNAKRKALRAELLGAVSNCRTTNQIGKLFPELVKYLPKDPWEPAANPPSTQVVQHLLDVGWPASEKPKE